jgi:methanogenic corrinoid protein MtbC1
MAHQQPMATMRQQIIPDDSFSEAAAMRMMRSLASESRSQARAQADRHAALARTVEEEVIPRLLPRLLSADQGALPVPASPMTDEVATLTDMVLAGTQPQATAFVQQMQSNGIRDESLFLNLLTPAARKLGEMWEADTCDFAAVTIGMLRLGSVMRLVAEAFEAETIPVMCGPRALLVQAPGEQHGFGIAMVASFFRRAGWNVLSEPMPDSATLVGLVQREWFSLVGISVGSDERLEGLAVDIRAIRAASRNPAVGIMVGGFPFIDRPHLARSLGADGTATDARLAVQQANALVSQLACAQ